MGVSRVEFLALVLGLPQVALEWPQRFHSRLLAQPLEDGQALLWLWLVLAPHQHGLFLLQLVVALLPSVALLLLHINISAPTTNLNPTHTPPLQSSQAMSLSYVAQNATPLCEYPPKNTCT